MPYIQVGSGDDLILTIPTTRTTNWNDSFKTSFAQLIAEHDHTGSGKGRTIPAAALTDNSIKGTKILLDNDTFLRWRNAADSANLNVIKTDANDNLYFGIDISLINLNNDLYLKGRNNADSAYINMIKVTTADKLALGADLTNIALLNDTYYTARNNADSGYINMFKVNTSDTIDVATAISFNADVTKATNKTILTKEFTIADNQSSAANITGVTVSELAGKSFKLIYSIYVDATTDLVEKGESIFSYDGTNWDQSRESSHDDTGVIFSISSGQLQYTSPAFTGYSDATLKYHLEEL